MNDQTKRQLIKAVMRVSDEDINSITDEEIKAEKDYYREMGYIE